MFAGDLEQLRTDTGELDTGRLTDLARRVLTERPGLRKPGLDFGIRVAAQRRPGARARPLRPRRAEQARAMSFTPPAAAARSTASRSSTRTTSASPSTSATVTPAAAASSATRTTRHPRAASSPAAPHHRRTITRPTRRSRSAFTYTPAQPALGDEITLDAKASSGQIDRYEWLGITCDEHAEGMVARFTVPHRRAHGP